MATNVWASEGFFTEIVAFRRDPLGYLNANKTDEENFSHDILQALVEESVSVNCKVQLLGILEEFSSQLLSSVASVEYTIASLLNITKQNPSISSSLTGRQILITITSLLVSREFKDDGQLLFRQFVEDLLDIVVDMKRVSRHLRATACLCLEQLELFWPGLLLRKLEYFYQLCQTENSPAVQGYMLLFARTLANAVAVSLHQGDSLSPSHITDLLCNRTEPLKPFTLQKTQPCFIQRKELQIISALPSDLDVRELQRAVSFILDHTYLLSTPSLVIVFRHLMEVVRLTPQISTSIFKGALLRYSHTRDTQMLQIVLEMAATFGERLVREEDMFYVNQTLLLCLRHPSLPVEQQLLIAEWFQYLPTSQQGLPRDARLPWLPVAGQYAVLFPLASDRTDTQVKKLELLSLAVERLEDEDILAGTLLRSLSCLHKYMLYGTEGREAAAFFHCLFVFYSRHHKHPALVQRIETVLVELVGIHPKYTPLVMDFIEAIHAIPGSRSVVKSLLLAMMTSMTSDPRLSSGGGDLRHHLLVLKRIAQEKDIDPKMVLQHLSQVLSRAELCDRGDWLLGNLVLGVCQRVIQSHDTRLIFQELGDILCTLSNDYEDVDIRDRAKFYYTMLTLLSTEKAASLLVLQSQQQKSDEGLAKIVTGNTHFSGRMTVVHLEAPVITMSRVPNVPENSPSVCEEVSVKGEDLLKEYDEHWRAQDEAGLVSLTYDVALCDLAGHLSEIFAVVLQFHSPQYYSDIKEVHLPYLASDKCEGSDHFMENSPEPVSVSFKMEHPCPTDIRVRATFMCREGTTYTCPLEDLTVTLDDLFQPLPCRPLPQLKQKVFSAMWDVFTHDPEQKGYVESVVVLHSPPAHISNLVSEKWSAFIVAEPSEECDFYHVAMFLPPHHHLLFRVKGQDDRTVVSITTDECQLLPMISSYLKEIDIVEE